jgi:hypothetical protein
MEYRFKAEEWKSLTPQQRASRCRLMAREARALADECAADVKLSYLKIADDWIQLADEIERAK